MNKAQHHEQLAARTEDFALRIIRLFRSLPNSVEAQVIGKQVLRSGTSIGANYSSAGRGRSRAEFASKMGVVVEEAAETVFWVRLLVRSGVVQAARMQPLLNEAQELLRIFAASHHTARKTRKAAATEQPGRSAAHPLSRSADAAESLP